MKDSRHKVVMGAEIEHPVSRVLPDGTRSDQGATLHRIIRGLQDTHPWLPDAGGNGIFLPNARVYGDCGKLEYATCECSSPAEVTAQLIAGERLLAEHVNRHNERQAGSAELLVYRCNVDYSGAGASWGAHESYLCGAPPSTLAELLIPHLVSRIVYTGAGGWRIDAPGLRFALSPRAFLFQDLVSTSSTHERPIYHVRSEPLCRGHHRVHVILGSALCSHWAMYLKYGATALVILVAQKAARSLSSALPRLANPLAALRTVAEDVACQKSLRLYDGTSVTAVEVQRRYLKVVSDELGQPWMPTWADEVCEHWDTTLTLLENDDEALLGRLDWVTKRKLYGGHLEKRGLDWGQTAFFSSLCHQQELVDSDARMQQQRRLLLDGMSPVRRALRDGGHSMDEFSRFLKVRQELFELDIRFGLLGSGLFDRLDRQGAISHRLPAVSDESIEAASRQAPPGTRAAVRDQAIRRLARATPGYICDWDRIASDSGTWLDLRDPFEVEERWIPSA